MNPTQIEQFIQQLLQAIPKDFTTTKEDMANRLKAAATTTLEKMNMVSREEFDIQTQLLARTRERLEEIEKKLNALEKQSSRTET